MITANTLKVGDFFALTWSIFAGPVTINCEGGPLDCQLNNFLHSVFVYLSLAHHVHCILHSL